MSKAVLLLLSLWLSVPALAQSDDLGRLLVSFGYRITHHETPAPTEWETSQFRLQSKRSYAIKAAKARGSYRLRFVVEEETYDGEADAAARLGQINRTPPGVDSKMQPEYVLREGFRHGAKVYTVSTDVYAFVLNDDLKRMRERLEKAIAPPLRSVKNNVLASAALPQIRLRFAPQFKYAGVQTFLLYNRARAEQHFFVQADTRRNIRRLYLVQFEGYLPNVTDSYGHEDEQSIRLGADEYGAISDFVVTTFALKNYPQSDTGRAATYLQNLGYKIPEHLGFQRFRRVLDEARRNEILILYFTDLSPTGLTAFDLAEDGRAYEQRGNMLQKLAQQATAGFKVVP